MTIRHLKVFIAVCENGGITRAAEALHVAQPSVSFTVSELEKYYNVTLFDRVGQRIIPTEEGRALLVKAKQVIADFDEFEQFARGAGERPSLKIGSSMTLGRTLVPRMFKKIRNALPNADLRVSVNSTAFIENEVINGRLDFAVVEGKISDAAVVAEQFATDRLAAVCGKDYCVENSLSVSRLASCEWLLREKGSASRDFFDNALSGYGVKITPVLESSGNNALISAAENGIGIAVLPYALVKDVINGGSLREIELENISLFRALFVIYHKNKKFTDLQSEVIKMVKEEGERL